MEGDSVPKGVNTRRWGLQETLLEADYPAPCFQNENLNFLGNVHFTISEEVRVFYLIICVCVCVNISQLLTDVKGVCFLAGNVLISFCIQTF